MTTGSTQTFLYRTRNISNGMKRKQDHYTTQQELEQMRRAFQKAQKLYRAYLSQRDLYRMMVHFLKRHQHYTYRELAECLGVTKQYIYLIVSEIDRKLALKEGGDQT